MRSDFRRIIAHPQVGILTEGTASTSHLLLLKSKFSTRNIQILNANDLCNPQLIETLDILVAPGVTSEDSHYPLIFTPQTTAIVYEAIYKGLKIWATCAAAYFMASLINYSSNSKKVDNVPGIGFFNGKAYGPVDGLSPIIDPNDVFSDVRVLQVDFMNACGAKITTGVCYGNGPAYFPSNDEKLDIIASYSDFPGVAIAYKKIGKGGILFSGPLPELALAHMPSLKECSRLPSHVVKLVRDLYPHEYSRAELMRTMMRRLGL